MSEELLRVQIILCDAGPQPASRHVSRDRDCRGGAAGEACLSLLPQPYRHQEAEHHTHSIASCDGLHNSCKRTIGHSSTYSQSAQHLDIIKATCAVGVTETLHSGAVCDMQMGSFEIRVRRSSKGSSGANSLNASSYNGSEPAFPIPPPGALSLLVSADPSKPFVVSLQCMSRSLSLHHTQEIAHAVPSC